MSYGTQELVSQYYDFAVFWRLYQQKNQLPECHTVGKVIAIENDFTRIHISIGDPRKSKEENTIGLRLTIEKRNFSEAVEEDQLVLFDYRYKNDFLSVYAFFSKPADRPTGNIQKVIAKIEGHYHTAIWYSSELEVPSLFKLNLPKISFPMFKIWKVKLTLFLWNFVKRYGVPFEEAKAKIDNQKNSMKKAFLRKAGVKGTH